MQSLDPIPAPSHPVVRRWPWVTFLLSAAMSAASCVRMPVIAGSATMPVATLSALAMLHGCRKSTDERTEARPKARFSLKSGRFPLTVHWLEADRQSRAQALLHYVEAAWQREVVDLGWPAALPDGGKGGDDTLDLYLVPLGPGKAYVAEEHRQTKPYEVATSYVAFDQDLKDDGTLESYAFHEFNHVCQYAMDANEGDAFYENTAAFMDRFLKPDGPASQTGIADFQKFPEKSVDYIASDWSAGEYEYGAGLFLQFLVEQYGKGKPDLVRRLWELGRQPHVNGAADANEPDWQDVLPTALKDVQAPDVATALTAFAAWRLQASSALAAPTAHSTIPQPALIVDGGHPAQVQPPTSRRPAPWGANFLRLDAAGAKGMTLKLTDGGKGHWGLWLGTRTPDGGWRTTMATAERPSVSLALGTAPVYAAVVNLGVNHDPDRQDWAGQAYRLQVDWQP